MELTPMTWTAITTVFVGGVAWGAVKVALNGTRTRVKEIQSELHMHIREEHEADVETHERIARMETKIDMLLEMEQERRR